MPATESLKDTVARVLPFWNDSIAPAILRDRRVLVTAHGNSLRALIKHLDRLSDDEIVELNVPTARPLVYELDSELKPIRHYYLGDAGRNRARDAGSGGTGSSKEGVNTLQDACSRAERERMDRCPIHGYGDRHDGCNR